MARHKVCMLALLLITAAAGINSEDVIASAPPSLETVTATLVKNATDLSPSAPPLNDLDIIRAQTDWINRMMAGSVLPAAWYEAMPRPLQGYLRNFIGSLVLYFGLCTVWAYYVYVCFGDTLFAPGTIPAFKDMREQMWVATQALPLYAALPSVAEYFIEEGYTRVYANIDAVGLPAYVGLFFLYMLCVEYGVYWAHRGLHESPTGYRLLHHTHHKYNKEHTLSPYAGLAFNALDGILQALSYCIFLLVVPMHYLTHLILLFLTAVWTANIHDNIHADVKPVMGAGYHTIHHTTYKHNYGHYFTFMDYLHGTLRTPEEHAEMAGAVKKPASLVPRD